MFRVLIRRGYSAGRPLLNESEELLVNLSTPHSSVLRNKAVELLTLPGEAGVYAITKGHAPTISQLQPGVVSVTHVGVKKNLYEYIYFYFMC